MDHDDAVLVIPASQGADIDSYASKLLVQDESCEEWADAEPWEVELLQSYVKNHGKDRWQLISGHRIGQDTHGFYVYQHYVKRYFGVQRKFASVALRATAKDVLPFYLSNSADGGLLEKVMRSIPALTVDMRKQILTAAFRNADTNDDGTLSKAELGSLMRRVACYLRQKDLDAMLRKVDTNRDGRIDYSEFVSWVLSQAPDAVKRAFERSLKTELDVVKATFRIWDKNGDGLIAKAELADVMTHLWKQDGSTKKQIRALIDTVDVDGDGKLDYGEFIEVLFADH